LPASVEPGGVKFMTFIPSKIFITHYERNHSDFHPGMAVFVPFYSI